MAHICVLASVVNPNKETGNLGDLFGYVLMEHFCKEMNITVKRLGTRDTIEDNTFAVVGSICHLCNVKAQTGKITIIGCGMIKHDDINWNHDNIIWKGVRGPETLKRIHRECPIISDPGLLISSLFPINRNPVKKIGYIIHSVDREAFFQLFPEKKQDLINNYSTYENFINQLSQYECVISSSLHGVIFCHSYSIPVCSIKVTNKITGDNFKYIDYYHSIGNYNFINRHAIDNNTNFEELLQNEWQPDIQTIDDLKNNLSNGFTLSSL